MARYILPILLATVALVLAACGESATPEEASPEASAAEDSTTTNRDDATTLFAERMSRIDQAVSVWRNVGTIEEAGVAAETAANLVVGPNGPDYGDRNGDGVVDGETIVGVLPGIDGTPEGLAHPLAANSCVARDVLGGTWEDPAAEWQAMATAIDRWRPDNNTMPSLGSHPMRIVGWATFTIASDSLEVAHEYAGHAKLHVDTAIAALDC